jgi:hypothetical protein
MTGTTTGIIVFVVVAVALLAVWLFAVHLSERRPYFRHRKQEPMRGVVQGGQHMGGGRSVMPTRDAPVPPGGGDPPTPEEQDEARAGRRSGNPMDL